MTTRLFINVRHTMRIKRQKFGILKSAIRLEFKLLMFTRADTIVINQRSKSVYLVKKRLGVFVIHISFQMRTFLQKM